MALKDYYDRIYHVGVPTEDMAATVRFYTDLGFTLIYETKNGDQQVCFLENGSIQIEAYTVELAANIRGAIDHLALNCTDIEAAFEEAKKLPYKILEGIKKLNEQGSTIIYTSHYMEEVEQICTRIAIMDHGRVIAQGTKEELKQMIKTGETITVEAIALEEKNLQDIRTLDHVFDVQYEKQVLIVRCTDAKHNLIRLLNYLQSQDISFGRVFSELPTLNDVFLEITGKQLRD